MSFVRRIANIADNASRMNVNHTLKLRERAVDSIMSPHYTTSSEDFRARMAFNFAVALRYLTPNRKDGESYFGVNDQQQEYKFTDPETTFIPDTLMGLYGRDIDTVRGAVMKVLSNTNLWSKGKPGPMDLTQNTDFTSRTVEFYNRMVNGEKALDVLKSL